MNEILIHTIYASCTGLAYTLAYGAKIFFSGTRFSNLIYYTSVTCSLAFGFIHYQISENDYLPFFGYFKSTIIEAISLVMIILHLMAVPTPSPQHPWWRRQRFDPRIRRHKLTFENYRIEHRKKSRIIYWITRK